MRVREANAASPYAPSMTRVSDERGGTFLRLIATLFVIFLLATAGLFVYTRTQDPLSVSDDASIGFNAVLADHGPETPPVVKLEPNGQIYLATTIHNDGSLPITITGLGPPSDEQQTPYIPVNIQAGDGKSPDPASAATLTSDKLEAGSGIGVLVTYAANSNLLCSLFDETSEGSGTEIRSFTIRYTTFGIPATQTLDLGRALATVSRPTRSGCEQATP
jgi:hypothetical protein